MTILSIVSSQAQTTRISKSENFYLTINEDDNYIVKNVNYSDNTEILYKDHTINVKRNSLDIYLNWINPLKFKLLLKDSIINDVRVEEIKKFFTENVSGLAGGNSFIRPGAGQSQVFQCATINAQNPVSKLIPTIFNSFSGSFGSDSELCNIWQLATETLALQIIENEDKIKKQITSIYNADNSTDAKKEYDAAIKTIKKFSDNTDKTIAKLYTLNESAEKISSSSKVNLKLEILKIHKANSDSFKNSKKLIELLKLYCIQIKASLEKKSNDLTNHFRIKNLSLKQSKSISVNISLTKRELKKDFSIADKSLVKSFKLLVQRYDFITPKIASGLFYSSATLNGFGVSTNTEGELVVTKDDVEKNTALTGVFLNLNMDIGSQFLQPLLQIGVDPTKEKPYLLFGGGISIPVSNFSITGGPIWTWEPELNNLKVDDTVISTSLLEEDLEYKFQTSPRGFYLGLNYSF